MKTSHIYMCNMKTFQVHRAESIHCQQAGSDGRIRKYHRVRPPDTQLAGSAAERIADRPLKPNGPGRWTIHAVLTTPEFVSGWAVPDIDPDATTRFMAEHFSRKKKTKTS
ncbi:hypothetical protein Pst134EA_032217 [Puccinia striiformis f. sp. tritici]|uniref:uncharacterized protein n=1 Tax=Puccinia striiformis f. sp. tritici TaxID=168172 RepID=UPI00200721D7|nr:uncharacterized protein Pst134EA_032217 [Puccinia striiformis f. sp. tritici]KAH9441816.1 hypothetical protein Pst134EA_032217 [Puccinia striiformis f. sp. tritici]